jgi:ketosteroid isomerase-like protein
MKIPALVLSAGVAVALATAAATRTPAPSHAADVAAITAFNSKYLQAINTGDSVALSALTDEDHIMIVPNRAPIVGKAANDAANGRGFQQYKFDEHWTPLETVVSGDLAYQRGTYTVNASPKSGSVTARESRGNFLRIYRRQTDGSWRMTRDMFNSDQPPPAN